MIPNDGPRDATRVSTSTMFLTFALIVSGRSSGVRLLLGLESYSDLSSLYSLRVSSPRVFSSMYALSGYALCPR
jgi:hypothetical protein